MNFLRRFPKSRLRTATFGSNHLSKAFQPSLFQFGIRGIRVERKVKFEAAEGEHVQGAKLDRSSSAQGTRREMKWKRFLNRNNYTPTDIVIGTFCLSASCFAIHKMWKLNYTISGILGFIIFYIVWQP